MPESKDSGSFDEPTKRLDRRSALRLLGVSLSGAAAVGTAVLVTRKAPGPGDAPAAPAVSAIGTPRGRLRPLATGTAPKFFDERELAVLERAVDVILPDTDTPGARAAGVHWYLDDIARIETEMGEELKAGLARLDARARALGAPGFVEADDALRTRCLEEISDLPGRAESASAEDRAFFRLIKAETISAYYRSEIGQIGELEWVGHEFHDAFPGACSHGNPVDHPRPKWPRSRT